MKNLFLLFVFAMICMANSMYGAYRQNIPIEKTQPSGNKIEIFCSGDEFYHWLHDAEGRTIVLNEETGYYVYALSVNGQLIPSSHIVGERDTKRIKVEPNQNIGSTQMINILHESPIMKDRLNKKNIISLGKRAQVKSEINNQNKKNFYSISMIIEFPDEKRNLPGYKGVGNILKSVHDFYDHISYQRMNVVSTLYPTDSTKKFVAPHKRAYYSIISIDNPDGYAGEIMRTEREQSLLKSALQWLEAYLPQDIKLSGDDKNKIIDNIVFYVCGPTDDWNSMLWDHQWAFINPDFKIRGYTPGTYNFNLVGEADSGSSFEEIACHEMGHSLNAPDFYQSTGNPMYPVGYWSRMSANKGDWGAYAKWAYQTWIDSLTTVAKPGKYTIGSYTDKEYPANPVIRIPDPSDRYTYYTVEYRKSQLPYETFYKNGGLLVSTIKPFVADGNIYSYSKGLPYEWFISRNNIKTSLTEENTLMTNGETRTVGPIKISNVVINDNTASFDFEYINNKPFIFADGVNALTYESNALGENPLNVDTLRVYSNVADWKATSNADWLVLKSDNKKGIVEYTVRPNSNTAHRVGKITLNATGAEAQEFYVAQKGKDNNPFLEIIELAENDTIRVDSKEYSLAKITLVGNRNFKVEKQGTTDEDPWFFKFSYKNVHNENYCVIYANQENTDATEIKEDIDILDAESNEVIKKFVFVQKSPNSSGVEDITVKKSIKIFPTLVSDYFNIESEDALLGVTIINMLGQVVYNVIPSSNLINVEDLIPGQYIIRVQTNKSIESTRIIVK